MLSATHPADIAVPPGTLRSLVYSSNAVTRFYQEDLEQLLLAARAHNETVGITGILLYRKDQFIQFLEGPVPEVTSLIDRIEQDTRHTNVRIVVDEFQRERQFADWSMGYVPSRPHSSAALPGFRDSFADIAADPGSLVHGRAAKELALWFRVRSGRVPRSAVPG